MAALYLSMISGTENIKNKQTDTQQHNNLPEGEKEPISNEPTSRPVASWIRGLMFNIRTSSFVAVYACIAIFNPASANANGFSLKGTMWERASMATACKPDPLLLYSLALNESKTSAGKGMVAPHPFALLERA